MHATCATTLGTCYIPVVVHRCILGAKAHPRLSTIVMWVKVFFKPLIVHGPLDVTSA